MTTVYATKTNVGLYSDVQSKQISNFFFFFIKAKVCRTPGPTACSKTLDTKTLAT